LFELLDDGSKVADIEALIKILFLQFGLDKIKDGIDTVDLEFLLNFKGKASTRKGSWRRSEAMNDVGSFKGVIDVVVFLAKKDGW
jgi:hypothetical protein